VHGSSSFTALKDIGRSNQMGKVEPMEERSQEETAWIERLLFDVEQNATVKVTG